MEDKHGTRGKFFERCGTALIFATGDLISTNFTWSITPYLPEGSEPIDLNLLPLGANVFWLALCGVRRLYRNRRESKADKTKAEATDEKPTGDPDMMSDT